MARINRILSTPSSRIERWLGVEQAERISASMKGWYGPPIGIGGTPGAVWVGKDGDFVGRIKAGQVGTACDVFTDRVKRALRGWSQEQLHTLSANGLSGLSDAINAVTTNGKRFPLNYQKVGTTGVVAATNTLWYVGNQPAAGANGGAAPGGTAMDATTTGALIFSNPSVGYTMFLGSDSVPSAVSATLLLYDRLFSVTKTMNSTGTESVTGTLGRYNSTTTGNPDYAAGNFLMIECRTALAATAHNWTTCTYTDQDGNTGATLPSVTGNSSNIINRLDQPTNTWFCPLASGDTGIKALTQMQCSALVATGAIDFTIGHPISFAPMLVANLDNKISGISDDFGPARIFDSACLAFLEILKSATGAATYTGTVWVTQN